MLVGRFSECLLYLSTLTLLGVIVASGNTLILFYKRPTPHGKMSVVGSVFLSFESDDSPMHVAGLLVFELPERSKATFGRNLSNLGAYIYEAFEHLESAVLDPLHEHGDSGTKKGKAQ
jgi:hypothetical protein